MAVQRQVVTHGSKTTPISFCEHNMCECSFMYLVAACCICQLTFWVGCIIPCVISIVYSLYILHHSHLVGFSISLLFYRWLLRHWGSISQFTWVYCQLHAGLCDFQTLVLWLSYDVYILCSGTQESCDFVKTRRRILQLCCWPHTGGTV